MRTRVSRRALTAASVAVAVAIVATLSAPSPVAGGDVSVSFPLGEHYRLGKYVPTRVVGTTDEVVRVEAPGALPVRVSPAAGSLDAVVPLLAVGAIGRDDWRLRPLADDERLVGATTPDAALAASLFPGRRVIVVTLDLADPLPGPAMAWGALDAVFLDAASAARVTEEQLATLLASDAIVAVRADARPIGLGPWRRQGAWWVAGIAPPAPPGLVQPERHAQFAYETPGWPPAVRYKLLLSLGAFSLAVLGVTLWRSRRAWVACVLLSLVAAAAIALWCSRQPKTVRSIAAAISGVRLDLWSHYAAVTDGEFRHTINAPSGATWPIFFSERHARDVDLHLKCGSDGSPIAFAGHLKRGQRILFLTRAVGRPITPTPSPATAPAARTR